MWGILTSLYDILIPHLKGIFELSYTGAILVQFAFFASYAIFALPGGKVVDLLGYKRTMILGLLTMTAGALLFIPASKLSLLSWSADRVCLPPYGIRHTRCRSRDLLLPPGAVNTA